MATDRFKITGVVGTRPWDYSDRSIFKETCLEGLIKIHLQSEISYNPQAMIDDCLYIIQKKYNFKTIHFTPNQYPDIAELGFYNNSFISKWIFWMLHEQLQIAIRNYYLKKNEVKTYEQE